MNHDKTARFDALIQVLDALPGLGCEGAILDVGGYPGDFADFCGGRRRVTTVDVPPCDRPGYVQASGADLPFKDGEFAAVVSSDTLEHIPPGERRKFIAECMRCASQYAVIGCPWGHPAVTYCEDSLRGLHQMLYPTPHPWLDEHGRFGLPEMDEMVERFREAGAADVAVWPSMPLRPWFYHHGWSILGGAFRALEAMPGAAALATGKQSSKDCALKFPCYRLFYIASQSGKLPDALHQAGEAAAWANQNLFESEMEILRNMAQAFRACAGEMKSTLGCGDQSSPSARLDENYIRRLESLVNQTQQEMSSLRRDLGQANKRHRRLARQPIVRLLMRLGMLPKID